MHNKRVVVTLDGFEQRLMVNGLVELKNNLQRQGKPPEDVEDLILKIIDAPTEKERRHDREMR